MDYFEAVQEGRRRVNRAVGVLQDVAGPCHTMLFLKLGVSDWTPVGEEMLQKIIPGKGGTAALVLCDSDGNAKVMSAWLPAEKANEYSRLLETRGVVAFLGEVKLPI
jgi:hypothetical protein